MQLNDFLNQKSEWLKGTGPQSDIVISSRIRLARNLEKNFFPNHTNKKQAASNLSKIKEALAKVSLLKKSLFLSMSDLDDTDKQFLVERHLMSHEHAQRGEPDPIGPRGEATANCVERVLIRVAFQ